MELNLQHLKNKHGLDINGIIHVGAHKAEELDDYLSIGVKNIIWIEVHSHLIPFIEDKIKNSSMKAVSGFQWPTATANQKVFNYLVSDADDNIENFYVSSNIKSSSILKPKKHLEKHPHVKFNEPIQIKTITLDTVMVKESVDTNNYNFINMDVQGAELKVLKGATSLLHNIDYIYSEVNISELYENCVLIEEMDNFLQPFGFERVETEINAYDWGDALFIKNKSKVTNGR